jgi:hypothetical protein
MMSAMTWQGWDLGQPVDHRHGGVFGQLGQQIVI